jgi:hypothetical protein
MVLVPVGAIGTATTGDVLTGKTFSSESEGVEATGTMPDRGSLSNVTPGNSESAGYYDSGTIPESGVNILATKQLTNAKDDGVTIGKSLDVPSGTKVVLVNCHSNNSVYNNEYNNYELDSGFDYDISWPDGTTETGSYGTGTLSRTRNINTTSGTVSVTLTTKTNYANNYIFIAALG